MDVEMARDEANKSSEMVTNLSSCCKDVSLVIMNMRVVTYGKVIHWSAYIAEGIFKTRRAKELTICTQESACRLL